MGKFLTFFLIIIFLIYANSLGNAFVADDIAGIANNLDIGNFNSIISRPLGFIGPFFYFIAYGLGGLNPFLYHLFNIFFHLSNVILIFILIKHLKNQTLAFITALLFAIHPILTESVTWISACSYLQYTFFSLLSLYLFILFSENTNKKKYLWFSVISFYFALASSEKAIILPLIIVFYLLAFPNKKFAWKFIFAYAPIVLLFGFNYLGAFQQRTTALQTTFYQEKAIANPLLQIPIAFTSYLELIFWPQGLTLYHSEMSFTATEFFIKVIIFIIFISIIAVSFRKNKLIFFWLSFFLISLLPTMTPFGISWVVAERYVYLGTIGIAVITAIGIIKIGQIFKNERITYGITAVLVLLLSVRTILRNADWQNQDTLWLSAAKYSPSSSQNHNNLGDLYARHGDLSKAAEEFQIAINLKPNYGDAYHNLAGTYLAMGKADLAIKNYQKALSFNPHLWQSYQNLGAIYFNQNDFVTAKEYFKKAILVNSQSISLHFNLGVIYVKLGDRDNARQEFLTTLQLDPYNLSARQGLAEVTK